MINIENLTVNYGEKVVYDGLNLQIEDDKITCILGESGCGKTTLLNAVAGIVKYGGSISQVVPAYVFQSPRLMPGVTVIKNLTVTGASEAEAIEMLDRVGLSGRWLDYPKTLSGGEAQRVALCRAFLYRSDCLLMDEPFSSLDIRTKLSVMEIFLKLHAESSRCTLFVTHDVDEAVFLADRIIVMGGGGHIIDDFYNSEKPQFGANCPQRERVFNALLRK